MSHTKFQSKRRELFFTQISLSQKSIFRTEFPKNNPGFEISIFEIFNVPNFSQIGKTYFFLPKLAQKSIFRTEFPKMNPGFEISIFDICHVPNFSQNGESYLFLPKFYWPKNLFLERNFRKLTPDSKLASSKYVMYQISVKTEKLILFTQIGTKFYF